MGEARHTLQWGCPIPSARGAVILVHGRGSSPEDIAGLADAFSNPQLAFLAPAAPGGVWYPQRFLVPTKENEPNLSESLSLIGKLIEKVNEGGIGSERISLVGFSQGACLCLEYASRNPHRYQCVAALSGALVGPLGAPRIPADLEGTPVLLGCAESDAHIPLEYLEQSAEILTGFNAEVTKKVFPGSAHTVFAPEIEWIRRHLSF